jgi:hypothetical protein
MVMTAVARSVASSTFRWSATDRQLGLDADGYGLLGPRSHNRIHIRTPIMIMWLTVRLAQLGESAIHRYYTDQEVAVGQRGRHGQRL